jgi:hypothetical protein
MEPTLEQVFKEQKCPVCGKNFCRGTQWGYKKFNYITERWTYFCTWKCLRKSETEEVKKSSRIKVDQLNLDGELIKTFDLIDDAVAEVDGSYDGIRKACKESKKYKGYLWRYNKDDLPKV